MADPDPAPGSTQPGGPDRNGSPAPVPPEPLTPAEPGADTPDPYPSV